MRTYTVKFKDKERADMAVRADDVDIEYEEENEGLDSRAIGYNFLLITPEKENDITVAFFPFAEVLAVTS